MQPDKLKHFAVGSCLAGLGACHSILAGALLCFIGAAGKEVWDLRTRRGTPEWADLLWTLAGALPVLIPLAVWRLS